MLKRKAQGCLFSLIGVFLLSGCATPNLTGPKKTYKEDASQLTEGEAQVVIFRDKKSSKKLATPVIRIDDFVVGGLQPGQYVTAKICQGANQIEFTQSSGDSAPYIVNVRAEEGEILYLRMWELDEQRFDTEVLNYDVAKKH